MNEVICFKKQTAWPRDSLKVGAGGCGDGVGLEVACLCLSFACFLLEI
jgi:hypothetical protein